MNVYEALKENYGKVLVGVVLVIVLGVLWWLINEGYYGGNKWMSSRVVPYQISYGLSRPWDVVLNPPGKINFPRG